MKKNRKMWKVDGDWLTKLDLLMYKGFSAKQASVYMNCSESAAQKYMLILKQIHNGEPVKISSNFCSGAVDEYCQMAGIVRKADEQLPGQVSIDAQEEKPAMASRLEKLQTEMVESIGRFVWEVIGEYMKHSGITEERA